MSDVLFKFKIEVPKHVSQKNQKRIFVNKRTGARFLGQETKGAFIKKEIIRKMQIEKLKSRLDTINCDINVSFVLEYPESVYFTKKNTRSNRVLDASNGYQIYEDALEIANIIENDSQICSHNGSNRLPVPGTKYYVEIIISKLL